MNKYIKLLVEGFFDDLDDIVPQDTMEEIGDEYNNIFIETCENILCKQNERDRWHNVYPEEESGLTLVKQVESEPNVYYISPYTNYKICKLGPRKRKQYSLNYFYRYVLEYDKNIDGYILYILNGTKGNCTISDQVCEFIEKSGINIKELRFRKSGNDRNALCDPFTNLYIFHHKFSDDLVNNFPDKLINGSISNENRPYLKFFKTQFSSNEMFIKFIKKLINNGYKIIDENKIIYDETNIEQKENELLSGEQAKRLQDIADKKEQFIINQLGQNYIDKFYKIKDYIDNVLKIRFYLATINTLRVEKNKISKKSTIPELLKSNNLKVNEEYLRYQINAILHKCFFILQKEEIAAWKTTYGFYECLDGTMSASGFYKNVDINDLPIKIKSLKDIYILYYVLAKACTQCDGIDLEQIYNSGNACVYINDFNYSKPVNLDTFNFEFLNNQLKFIIDKVMKKYKLK